MLVGGIEVDVVKKNIKNIHLAVYPPHGRVRLAAPMEVSQQTIELFVISKIAWIRKQQRAFSKQSRQTPRQYVNRETHYLLGKPYLLRLIESDHPYRQARVSLKNKKHIEMTVKPDATVFHKENLLKEWYRAQLKKIVDELVAKWEAIIGVDTNLVTVKSMKTKWGSCNTNKGNILINLELIKKPYRCIEYIVVHELVHLLERKHNDQFMAYMDKFLPNWEKLKVELNKLPVSHQDWEY